MHWSPHATLGPGGIHLHWSTLTRAGAWRGPLLIGIKNKKDRAEEKSDGLHSKPAVYFLFFILLLFYSLHIQEAQPGGARYPSCRMFMGQQLIELEFASMHSVSDLFYQGDHMS